MAVTIDGAGPLAGATTLNGLTIPTTGFGKVLQVVRATDTTNRSTTSVSMVDANISVTITPQKNTSAVLLIWTAQAYPFGTVARQYMQITDSSNTTISGAQTCSMGQSSTEDTYLTFTIIAYATPATTSPVTYKGRYKAYASSTARLENTIATGQLYAIEVSA